MNKEELEKLIVATMLGNGIQDDREALFDGDDMDEYLIGTTGSHIFKEEDSHGGYEGGGEEAWNVYSVREENSEDSDENKTFFRVEGYYNSWEGTEWGGDFKIVTPYIEPVRKWKVEIVKQKVVQYNV